MGTQNPPGGRAPGPRCWPAAAPALGRQGFVLPFLDAKADYAQFPAGLTRAELARMPAYCPKWLVLLPKVEAATAMVTKRLKVVAALAGIKKIRTTHTARHSFADRDYRLGLPAADMRDMPTHHSISQTEEYFAELEHSELN